MSQCTPYLIELYFLSQQPLHDADQFLGFSTGDATPAKRYDSYGSAFRGSPRGQDEFLHYYQHARRLPHSPPVLVSRKGSYCRHPYHLVTLPYAALEPVTGPRECRSRIMVGSASCIGCTKRAGERGSELNPKKIFGYRVLRSCRPSRLLCR